MRTDTMVDGAKHHAVYVHVERTSSVAGLRRAEGHPPLDSHTDVCRGGYGEISGFSCVTGDWQARTLRMLAGIEARGFDAHGGWQTGAAFDKKGRGEAVNCDIYGLSDRLAVVQVREYSKRHAHGWARIRKNYFLIGRNERGTVFAHPIPSGVVRGAIRRDPCAESCVRAAQAWIWGIAEKQLGEVVRQGDVALVPVAKMPASGEELGLILGVCVADTASHFLSAAQATQVGDDLYLRDPEMHHQAAQHPSVYARGAYLLRIGRRAETWTFARPTRD